MAKFKFEGNEYNYFTSTYNDTRHNERAVEIALAIDYVSKFRGCKILEVGNVLSNYLSFDHDIVDKYDKGKNIIKQDIVEYTTDKKYDLIISISTFEHIGWDSGGEGVAKGTGKIITALDHTKTLLAEVGTMLITLPLGYNSELDTLLKEKRIQFDKVFCMKRDEYNGWAQIDLEDALKMDYSREGCYVGEYVNPEKDIRVGLITNYTRFLVVGFIYGKKEKKEYKAIFNTSMDSGIV